MKLATVLRLALIVTGLLALEVLCRFKFITPLTMVAPSQFAAGLFNILFAGQMNAEISVTLLCIAAAGLASIIAGFLFGVALFKMPRARRALDPYLAGYYAIPIFVFYPVFIVFFGLNIVPIIIIGFLNAVVMMVMNTLNGLDRIPQVLMKAARMMKLTPLETVRDVMFPSAFPHVLTGVKFAIAYAFVGVIGAEFILASQGLGYQVSYTFANFDNTAMYGLILLIVCIAVAVNSILFFFERRTLRQRGLS